MQTGDDDLFDRVEDLLVGFDHLFQPPGHRRDNPIGQQHAQKGPDQRRTDHPTQHRGGLIDRTHGLDHAEHRGNDPQRGQGIGQPLQGVLRFVKFVEMLLHRIVHHLFHSMNFQRPGRNHDQRQRVADQRGQRVVRQ